MMHLDRQALLWQEGSSAPTVQKSSTTPTVDVPAASAATATATTASTPSEVMLSNATPDDYKSTAVMTPPPEKSDAPPRAGTGGDSRYQAARDKMYDTVEELERIEAAIEANRKVYHERWEEVKYSIDVEMKRRHDKEIKELNEKVQEMKQDLKAKHRAEEVTGKERYQAVVAEQREHHGTLSKEKELMLQRKHKAQRDAEHRRDSLSREDVLAYLEQCADEMRMRKRRKTQGTPDEDGKG
jgi:hypothetical protein